MPAGLPPDERLVELGLAYMGFAEENPADLRCILAMAAGRAVGAAGRRRSSWAWRWRGLLDETLREGVSGRPLPAARPDEQLTRTAFGFWALVHGMTALAGVNLGPCATRCAATRGVLRDFVTRCADGTTLTRCATGPGARAAAGG